MPARIPQDVDLEDRFVLGLTPVRFGYLVIGGLAAFCLWNARWGPVPARLTLALPLLLGGVTLAWGRWRGRPLDAWVGDLALFLRANVRVVRAPAPPAASADAPPAEPGPLLAIRAPAEVPALPPPIPPDPPAEAPTSARSEAPVQRDP
jgi:hypothetical protein